MVEKIGHIKNPLTVIAIFAGIAEISGTVVLPFLEPWNQSTYIWFLMGFPTLLICLFFYTLIYFNESLYAPSDYQDENNFFKSMRYASYDEKQGKIFEEVIEVETNQNEAINSDNPTVSDSNGNNEETDINNKTEETNMVHAQPSVLEEPAQTYNSRDYHGPANINDDTATRTTGTSGKGLRTKIMEAESLSILKLSEELNIKFHKDVSYTTNLGENLIFDALAVGIDGIQAIEVKYSKNGMIAMNTVRKVIHNAVQFTHDVSSKNQSKFTLHFVVVVGETFFNEREIKDTILKQARLFDINVVPHVYSMKRLANEFESSL